MNLLTEIKKVQVTRPVDYGQYAEMGDETTDFEPLVKKSDAIKIANEHAIEKCKEQKDSMSICKTCDGHGWTAEHDPSDPHENGCTNCPIQIQCNDCEGTGIIAPLPQELRGKE